MLNHFFQKNHNYRPAIACLGLALFVASCSAPEVTEEPAAETPSTPPEETVVAEEATAPVTTTTSSQATPVAPQTTPAPERNQVPTSREVASAPSALQVETTQPSDSDIETIMEGFAVDTPYATIRTQVIQANWVPTENPNVGEGGVERMAYDAGFVEVVNCSGTGAGYCSFDFQHPEKQEGLRIITYNGAGLNFSDWNLYPLNAAAPTPPTDRDLVQEARSAIPAQFQGKWDMSPEGCDVPWSDGRLVIGLDRVEFYESSGSATEILLAGELQMTLTADYSGEGSIWSETDVFRLSPDYSTITVNEGSTRYRCSS